MADAIYIDELLLLYFSLSHVSQLRSTMTVTTPKLFTSAKVGDVTLQHRIVMAPLTRTRATKDHLPTDLMIEHYAQRASTPGTLLISEATFIAPQAGGYPHIPGIWNEEQVAGWKRVIYLCIRAPNPCQSH
jgi:2,4-dienoyl-CoA reductase-like NADH-dependent reductase (Old Yellow Enzyme family)